MEIVLTQTSIGTFKTFSTEILGKLDEITGKDNLKEYGDYGHHFVLFSLKDNIGPFGDKEVNTKLALRIIGATVGYIQVDENLNITNVKYDDGVEISRIMSSEKLAKGKEFFESYFSDKKLILNYKDEVIRTEKELLELVLKQDEMVKNYTMARG